MESPGVQAIPDELRQPGLVEGDLPPLDQRDLLGVVVDPEDLVTEMGEAGRSGEPDVPGADDGDPHDGQESYSSCLRERPRRIRGGRAAVAGEWRGCAVDSS